MRAYTALVTERMEKQVEAISVATGKEVFIFVQLIQTSFLVVINLNFLPNPPLIYLAFSVYFSVLVHLPSEVGTGPTRWLNVI